MKDETNSIQSDAQNTKPTSLPWLWAISAMVIVIGIGSIFLGFYRDYTLVIDGESYETKALVFRVSDLFKQSGIELNEADWVSVDLEKFSLNLPETIQINRARKVSILNKGKIQQLNTAECFPANLLKLAGISLFPNDLVLQNGQPIDPYTKLPLGKELVLEYQGANVIHLNDHGKQYTFSTQAKTLGEAFAEQNILLSEYDRISMPLETALSELNELAIRRARQITVMVGEQSLSGYSAAESAEEALQELGMPLQNLDYLTSDVAIAGFEIPEDGELQVVRVNESIELIKEETAYSNTYELDPNTELDTTSVLVPGQMGYVVTRGITRFENGEPQFNYPAQHWKASDPVDGVIGRGTKPVVKTEVVDGVTLEYWRKVSVYATSYRPADFPPDARTRSGTPVQKGIIAVSAAWYPSMQGQRLYVPGYGFGVVGDSGYGIPGRYWIDLAYDDASYVGWHQWTTLYFLTPIPAYIPAILP